jgi:hypothetical protein
MKQSAGKKACFIGQALEINYFHRSTYLEVQNGIRLIEFLSHCLLVTKIKLFAGLLSAYLSITG